MSWNQKFYVLIVRGKKLSREIVSAIWNGGVVTAKTVGMTANAILTRTVRPAREPDL
jgi:hypothetical protein